MKKIINIAWMHCISCELILEKWLKKIKWATLIMVDHKKWLLEIDYKTEKDYNEVVKLIEKSGFKVKVEWENSIYDNSNIMSNIIILLVVVILLMFTALFDLYKFLPDTSTLSYSSAFLVWIIASVSSCLAITGWIIIGFSRYIDSAHWIKWHTKVQLWFQIWRILWFFLLGWILWIFWEIFSFWLTITGYLTFIVWFVLLYMWLNILKIVPSITKFWVHMPKSFASKIESLWKPKYAPIVWALTFFLPCWFTQSMQLLAVTSWSFWWGGLIMMIFALWTFPVLFSVWLWSSYFKEKKFTTLNKLIWAIVIFFWIFTISNSYNLLSVSNISTNQNSNVKQVEQINKNDIELELIEVWHDWWSTIPSEIKLKAGWNYKIIITPDSNWKGCMSTQVIPTLSKKVSYVRKWVPIEYEIYNARVWTYNIVCSSMWMLQWKITVR